MGPDEGDWEINVWPADPRIIRGCRLIGSVVKRRRIDHGYTQRHLEQLCLIDQSVISRLENGKLFGLRWQKFARLVDALDGLEADIALPSHRPWPGAAGAPPGDAADVHTG